MTDDDHPYGTATLAEATDCAWCWPEHHQGEHAPCTGCFEPCLSHTTWQCQRCGSITSEPYCPCRFDA